MKSFQTLLLLLWFSSLSIGQYNEKHTQILMREIGNKILWSVGDSISRVLPITKADKNRFVISFEKPIHIISDSLYKIVTHELRKIKVSNFLTEIKDCVTEDVILAFLRSETDSLNPCKGRSTPKSCFKIEVTINQPISSDSRHYTAAKESQGFGDNDTNVMSGGDSITQGSQFLASHSREKGAVNKAGTSFWVFIPLCLGLISFMYFLYSKSTSRSKDGSTLDRTENQYTSIGQYQFDPSKSQLIYNSERTILTEKEAKLLMILFNGINKPQKRDDLIGEIWGEEGLLVISRNIDVLVSKLRKKLQDDPQIKITNVHGVGYKLEL